MIGRLTAEHSKTPHNEIQILRQFPQLLFRAARNRRREQECNAKQASPDEGVEPQYRRGDAKPVLDKERRQKCGHASASNVEDGGNSPIDDPQWIHSATSPCWQGTRS